MRMQITLAGEQRRRDKNFPHHVECRRSDINFIDESSLQRLGFLARALSDFIGIVSPSYGLFG